MREPPSRPGGSACWAPPPIAPASSVQLDVGGAELCVDLAHDETATPAAIVAVDDLDTLHRLTQHGSIVVAGRLEKAGPSSRPGGNHLVFEATTSTA